MSWEPLLWRTAQRIEAAYRRCRSCSALNDAPWHTWQRLVDSLQLRAKAERRGWKQARKITHEYVVRDLERLTSELRGLRSSVERHGRDVLPNVGDLYAELIAAEEEFGGVAIDDFEIYVTTDPVTLEGIYLGPFEIRLNLGRIDEQEPYRIVAVDPHPAVGASDTPHPHIDHQKICLGEGKAAVAAALAEGRLGDLFQLINRVLHTYGEGSAYVELSRWHGIPCAECDAGVDEDDVYSCRSCDRSLCEDCARVCECGDAACHDCATHCSRCESMTCSGCLTTCCDCEEEFCASCLEEGLCHACREAQEEELAAAELEAEVAADDESELAVHAGGVGEAPVLARPRRHRSRRLRNLGRR